jgi:geranylgeranyl pyrophosphate synthase
MSVQITKRPLRMIPTLPQRPPQATVPQTLSEREHVRAVVHHYVEQRRTEIVPPLVLDELRKHADAVVALFDIDPLYRDYTGILISNEVWIDQLATVPFERRLLLLPKCLRVEDKCPAPFDEFGLLCKQCGLCTIQDLQEEAERLGYAVLVAEGSALVMALIQSGKIDAIVGVSCLSVLERAFPHMEAAAIPGIAIPLLQDDCKNTSVDIDWVWNVVHLTSDDQTRRLDLDGLRSEVQTWFTREALDDVFGSAAGETDIVARDWLAADGKRWRPFLTACAFKALQDDPLTPFPDSLKRAAVAVECFHKASLIHDDIEDADDQRYGQPTMHVQHGVPVALNVGDLLLGEGYRLLASCGVDSRTTAELIRIAAAGHRRLCLGQGAELSWMRTPTAPTADHVIDIFRQKTSPAFHVALGIGAALAGADAETQRVLSDYSDALGIAYQIRDDVEDQAGFSAPSLILALACDKAKASGRDRVMTAWRNGPCSEEGRDAYRALIVELGVEDRARALLEAYKEEAIRTLPALQNASLKGLLRRVIGKVFCVEIKGWCGEFETRNAAGRQTGVHAAG